MNFFWLCAARQKHRALMAKCQHSTVVAIDSIPGEIATPFQGFHNASKAALHSYTETLRMECEPLKVLVASDSIKSKIAVASLKPLHGLIEA
jgi:short-subunit dehydrogenase